MGMTEGKAQGLGPVRDRDQVHMVRHETEAEHGQAVELTIGFQKLEVDEAVGVGVEDAVPGVAALRDMVRQAGGDDASQTSHHAGSVAGKPRFSKTFRLSPSLPMNQIQIIRGQATGSCTP